jgi:hypothetical protein
MAMLLYRRQRKTWEESLRQATREKRSKSIKNALLVQQQNSLKQEHNSDATRGKNKLGSHIAKKHKTNKPKSSMFDNCS